MLSADEIKEAVESGKVVIEPFSPVLLKPASYVLRLADRWRRWSASREPLDVSAPIQDDRFLSAIETGAEIEIGTNEFCLGATIERVALPPDLLGIIAPVSHLSRWGLNVGLGSIIVSPGYGAGSPTSLTLEITSHNPSRLRLRAGIPVGHLIFARVLESRYVRPFTQSVYQSRDAPSGPLLAEEWKRIAHLH